MKWSLSHSYQLANNGANNDEEKYPNLAHCLFEEEKGDLRGRRKGGVHMER